MDWTRWRRRGRRPLVVAVALVIVAGCGSGGSSHPTAAPSLAALQVISTDVTVQGAHSTERTAGASGRTLAEGDTIRTNPAGFAEVTFFDGSFTRVDHAAELKLVDLADPAKSRVVHTELRSGRSWNRIEKLSESQTWQLDTPVASATVRGTAFVADCTTANACRFAVAEGTVALRLPGGKTITLKAGEQVTVTRGQPPPPAQAVGVSRVLADEWVARNIARDRAAGKPAIAPSADPSPLQGEWALTSPADGCGYDLGGLDGGTLTIDGTSATFAANDAPYIGTVEPRGTGFHISADEHGDGDPHPGNLDFQVILTGPGRISGAGTASGVTGITGYTCDNRMFTGTIVSAPGSTTSTTATDASALGSHPTYSNTAASGSGCSPGPGPLPDGWWYGKPGSTAGEGPTFAFDLACYYQGDIAVKMAHAAGTEAEDGYFVVNGSTTMRTISVAPDAEVLCIDINTGDLEAPCAQPPGTYFGIWIRIEQGRMTKLLEQFAP